MAIPAHRIKPDPNRLGARPDRARISRLETQVGAPLDGKIDLSSRMWAGLFAEPLGDLAPGLGTRSGPPTPESGSRQNITQKRDKGATS